MKANVEAAFIHVDQAADCESRVLWVNLVQRASQFFISHGTFCFTHNEMGQLIKINRVLQDKALNRACLRF